jgi:tetratricopeptide (TPR) repeat protein
MSQGDLARAEELGRRAVKAADQANDSANELLSSLTHLALVLSARGEYTEAEGLAARAQVLATALFGAVSREHADVSNVLAMIAKSRSQLAYAEIRSRQAVEMYETTAGPDHPLTLLAKKNLAGILGAQGKYKPARALLTEALGTLEKLDGAEHPDVISTVRDFAVLEFAQKHYGQAAELYRRVFETDMRTFGASNPRTRFDLNDLGSTEFARHRLHEAEELFIRAMTSERTGDARDSIVKANLAQVYQVQKRYEEAASLYREALEEFERSGRAQDPRLGSILASYASLLRVTGDYAQAEKLQARATALQVRGILGREGHAS